MKSEENHKKSQILMMKKTKKTLMREIRWSAVCSAKSSLWWWRWWMWFRWCARFRDTGETERAFRLKSNFKKKYKKKEQVPGFWIGRFAKKNIIFADEFFQFFFLCTSTMMIMTVMLIVPMNDRIISVSSMQFAFFVVVILMMITNAWSCVVVSSLLISVRRWHGAGTMLWMLTMRLSTMPVHLFWALMVVRRW